MPQDHFKDFWRDFRDQLVDHNRVANVVEEFCDLARQHTPKWVLVVPLIHLLKGESEPFQPVPPAFNPQSKGSHFQTDSGARSLSRVMTDHAYLADIDQRLVRSWMPLLHLDDLMDFLAYMQVELLDILHCMQINMKAVNHSVYMALKDLSSHLNTKESNRNQSFDDRYGECCLKTAVRLLGSVCRCIKEPGRCDVPLQFLELVCWISKIYSQIDSETRKRTQQESFEETLYIITEWRTKSFNKKLLNARNRLEFSSPNEIN
ncbi:hypothetical protein ILYODFUR_032847, partial [Ilyodon furcidens]